MPLLANHAMAGITSLRIDRSPRAGSGRVERSRASRAGSARPSRCQWRLDPRHETGSRISWLLDQCRGFGPAVLAGHWVARCAVPRGCGCGWRWGGWAAPGRCPRRSESRWAAVRDAGRSIGPIWSRTSRTTQVTRWERLAGATFPTGPETEHESLGRCSVGPVTVATRQHLTPVQAGGATGFDTEGPRH